jgi:hypothetical protein
VTSRRVLEVALLAVSLLAFACGAENEDTPASAGANHANETQYSRNVQKYLSDAKDSLAAAAKTMGDNQRGNRPLESAAKTPKEAATVKPKKEVPAKASNSPAKLKEVDVVPAPDPRAVSTQVDTADGQLDDADGFLEKLSSALVSSADTGDAQSAIREARSKVALAKSSLANLKRTLAAPDQPNAPTLEDDLTKPSGNLAQARAAVASAGAAADKIKVPANLAEPPSFFTNLISDWGVTAAVVLGALIALLLLGFGARSIVRSLTGEFDKRLAERVQPGLASMLKAQKEQTSQFSLLTSAQNEMSSRLADLHAEMRSVGKLVRDAPLDGGSRRAASSPPIYDFATATLPKEEPQFPVAAADYLDKMQRHASVVRPDFQNDILVDASDGKGELVLIKDSRIPEDDQALFIAPRATQFQTKQDFYTYYEKYYDCSRPSAGDVWIIEPAIVSRVQGGWQLRGKGVLEVR